jgi:hypothetical protein
MVDGGVPGSRGGVRNASRAFAVAGIAAALLLAPGAGQATTYKWVDDQGIVHYTDRVPPEAVNKGNVELNKQGVPVKKTDPALTPEQLRARAQEEERARVLAKQQEEVARRDRALLSSFTSESEIDLARNRTLQTIDSVIQSSKAYSEQLTKRKAKIETARTTEYANKALPAAMERELENINAELARQEELIALKQREIITVNAKYDGEKKRWRELIAAKAEEGGAAAGGATSPGPAPVPAPATAAAPKK